jgi:holin-like protein
MKYIKQFAIILAVTFLGETLKYIVPLPVPASIYGLLLMLAALKTKIIPVEKVREAGNFMIEVMTLMFIPAAVGLLDSWNILKEIWLPVIIVTIATTILVMAVTGAVTQLFIRIDKKSKTGRN